MRMGMVRTDANNEGRTAIAPATAATTTRPAVEIRHSKNEKSGASWTWNQANAAAPPSAAAESHAATQRNTVLMCGLPSNARAIPLRKLVAGSGGRHTAI